jgi:hypothetical protein
MRKICMLPALLLPLLVAGQTFEIGISGGFSIYNGDLAPEKFDNYLKTAHPAYGGFVRLNTGKHFSARLGLNKGQVSGADSLRDNIQRSLSFRSDLMEVYAVGEWNIVEWKPGQSSFAVIPYLYGGAAIYHFNPQAFHENQWVDLQPLGTEGQGLPGYGEKYELTQLSLPFGGGLKFRLGENISIGMELGGRKLFTDYLDDVSDTRIVYQDILQGNGSLAAFFTNPLIDPESAEIFEPFQRGKPAKDWYYIGALNVSYIFGGEKRGNGHRGGVRCYQF